MAGLPTTAGCLAVADTAGPARRDASLPGGAAGRDRRAAEARFVGKTNLHELAYGITGVNEAFGTPVNPLDPRRVPGGSSSGSATAVAAGEADVAYGTDTGGSIRIPAACCGIAGLKTTWGRISLDGVRPLAPSLDTVGPMAADVDGLIAGMALLEPGFAVAADAPRTVGRLAIEADPVVDAAVDDALRGGRVRGPADHDPGAPGRHRGVGGAARRAGVGDQRGAVRTRGRPHRRQRARPAPPGEHDHRCAAERRPDDEHPVEGGARRHLGPGRAAGGAHPARVPAADRRRADASSAIRGRDLAGERGRAARAGAAGARAGRAAGRQRPAARQRPADRARATARTGCWRRARFSSAAVR